MNFQAVSVGQKLIEKSNGVTGGYLDAAGTPTAALLSEFKFVDASIGAFVNELKAQGLYDSTLIVITAKHGQSPIDPSPLRLAAHQRHFTRHPALERGLYSVLRIHQQPHRHWADGR